MSRRFIKHKKGYTRPKTGTVIREILKLYCRPIGATSKECQSILKLTNKKNYRAVEYLIDMCGYDIRTFYIKRKNRKKHQHIHRIVHKCVGRYRWNGRYIDYTKKIQNEILE